MSYVIYYVIGIIYKNSKNLKGKEMNFNEHFQQESQSVTVDDMFAAGDDVMQGMSDLAERIAIEDDELRHLEAELSLRKDNLKAEKTQMYHLMVSNNCANGHKFDNGILLKPKVNTRIFKAAGVEDETMFGWLEEHSLGDIIRRMVPWQTLSSTMKAEIEQGKDLDTTIFNKSDEYTVAFAGNGKAKFLAVRRGE